MKILGGPGSSDEIGYYLSKGIRAERKKMSWTGFQDLLHYLLSLLA